MEQITGLSSGDGVGTEAFYRAKAQEIVQKKAVTVEGHPQVSPHPVRACGIVTMRWCGRLPGANAGAGGDAGGSCAVG